MEIRLCLDLSIKKIFITTFIRIINRVFWWVFFLKIIKCLTNHILGDFFFKNKMFEKRMIYNIGNDNTV